MSMTLFWFVLYISANFYWQQTSITRDIEGGGGGGGGGSGDLYSSWTYTIKDLKGEKVIGTFYEKELKKTNQKEFRIEKILKKRVISCMLNGKCMIILLIVGLIKKTLYKNESIFSYTTFRL